MVIIFKYSWGPISIQRFTFSDGNGGGFGVVGGGGIGAASRVGVSTRNAQGVSLVKYINISNYNRDLSQHLVYDILIVFNLMWKTIKLHCMNNA